MVEKLKQKTVKGLFWSFLDNSVKLGVQFIVGLILARLLEPREFGLVGMLTIFIAISQTFVDSGFSQALIRKKDCTDVDYSTVFYFNLAVAFCIYTVLFLTAGIISNFFNEPELNTMLKILGLGIIFNAFGIIQQTMLIRKINFKVQTNITIVSSLGSGLIAVILALLGFGVWSLVALTVIRYALNSLFLWVWSTWKPLFTFSRNSFNDLFSFGGRILIAELINTIYQQMYYLVIGKYFSAQDLGFYTRADQFKNLPSKNIVTVIQRVSFPVLSSIQDNRERLLANYKKLIRSTMFITFTLMFGMAAVAEHMVVTLIGDKWAESVIYLQLLCFVGASYPLHALNINMLNVKGRSDLVLKLEVIKKILAIPIILVGIVWGIKIMILAMIIYSVLGYLLNSYWSGKLIGYSTKEQVIDILPSILIAFLISSAVYCCGEVMPFQSWIILLIQLILGLLLLVLLGEFLKLKDYLYIREIIFEKVKSIRL